MNTTMIAVIAAFSLGFASAWGIQGLRWDNDVAGINLAASTANNQANEKARNQEQLWQETVNGIQRNAQVQLEARNAELVTADAAGVGVREHASLYASKAACPTTAANAINGANRAAMVLSDLFGRADKRAGDLADYADRLRIKLDGCIGAYQAIRISQDAHTRNSVHSEQ